jgi:serine/threonine protein kinase
MDFPAPEIIEEGQAFPQSDIWSLGVLLYVLLAGQLPFKVSIVFMNLRFRQKVFGQFFIRG